MGGKKIMIDQTSKSHGIIPIQINPIPELFLSNKWLILYVGFIKSGKCVVSFQGRYCENGMLSNFVNHIVDEMVTAEFQCRHFFSLLATNIAASLVDSIRHFWHLYHLS